MDWRCGSSVERLLCEHLHWKHKALTQTLVTHTHTQNQGEVIHEVIYMKSNNSLMDAACVSHGINCHASII
jgi:hypothetical protein